MSPKSRSRGNNPANRRPIASRTRGGLGGEQVEGRQAVRELLTARRRRVHDVWLSDSVDESSEPIAAILGLAQTAGVPVRRVGRGRLDAESTTDAPQGVLAHSDPLAPSPLEDLTSAQSSGAAPFLIVVDGVTDPQNLGAVLRTAECAGATGVVLAKHRSVHVTATVAKAAAGAIEHLQFALVSGIPSALSALRESGVWTVGLVVEGGRPIFGLEVASQPVALVLGSEGAGLGRLTRERCEVLASIPQLGSIASLNVAAAAAVACFEVARARTQPET